MLEHLLTLSLFILIAFSSVIAGEKKLKSTNVTVYNQNLGVVKEIREIDIEKGTSEIKIRGVAEKIDPTSVHIKFNGEVLEQNYQYDLVSMDKILQKYIDRDILISGKDVAVSGILLSANRNQLVIRDKDGGLTMLPNVKDYQINVGQLPEGLITRPTLVWLVRSNESGKQDVEMSYQTEGMKWHAEYVAVLNQDDTEMSLNSWVSIENNSGATYKEAKLKLVAGDVNIVKSPEDHYIGELRLARNIMVEEKPQFQEKAFFEYHIYKLQRPATVANNEVKQISLFEAEDVDIEKKYKYYSKHWQNSGKVNVVVEFKNSEENNLGMPMPKGKVRLYKSDGESIEFIGEDNIDHTPRKEDLSIKVGDAFDIVVKDETESSKKITKNIYKETYVTTIHNRKEEDIVVEVESAIGSNGKITKTNIEYEKKDAYSVIFKVPVEADEEKKLKYTVLYK